jgi:hypothetical protein
MARIFIS